MDVSDGTARKVLGQPAALRVRFAPAWLSWLPAVWPTTASASGFALCRRRRRSA